MTRTLVCVVFLVPLVQACCTCEHRARLPTIAATEAAQHEAIEWGHDLGDARMSFGDARAYWDENLASVADDDSSIYGVLKRQIDGKDCYLVCFGYEDSGRTLQVFVNRNPIEVLGAIGGM